MRKVLISWIGNNDIKASSESSTAGLGPVGNLLKERKFDQILLLHNEDMQKDIGTYKNWLSKKSKQNIDHRFVSLGEDPTNHGQIYESVSSILTSLDETHKGAMQLTYFLSPGTPSMHSIWVLLGKSRFPGQFIQSHEKAGISDVEIPFDMAIDYLPELQRSIDAEINRRASGQSKPNPAFENIKANSKVMREAIRLAEKVSRRGVRVLLEGSPGTGKALFAEAIHKASGRKEFIKVDCGDLVENAFSDEFFSEAHGGTLYLSRLNELPDKLQVTLLKHLNKASTQEDVRIIAGTDIELRDQIKSGAFRQELFYSLAAAIIKLPDIKRRGPDLSLLIEYLFNKLIEDEVILNKQEQKTLSAAAKRALLEHSWPGNVTELENTLIRAILWTDTKTIKEEDMRNAILDPVEKDKLETILNRELADGVDLPAILDEVQEHYLRRAWKESGRRKNQLTKILGLPSYQTASNWLERHNIK